MSRPVRMSATGVCYHVLNRGAPCGVKAWQAQPAARLNLECTICPKGGPRKAGKK